MYNSIFKPCQCAYTLLTRFCGACTWRNMTAILRSDFLISCSKSFIGLRKVSYSANVSSDNNIVKGKVYVKSVSSLSDKYFSTVIPDYLLDSISEIEVSENDVEEVEAEDYQMEDVIVDTLTAYVLPFEEVESCFTLQCLSCSCSNQHGDVFIDKDSGYFVCPYCSLHGSWEEFLKLLCKKEDTLTKDELQSYLMNCSPYQWSDVCDHHFAPIRRISSMTFKKLGACLNQDCSRLIIPVCEKDLTLVGFHSISIINTTPPAIRRFLSGKECALYFKNKYCKSLIATKCIISALLLYEFGYSVLVLPHSGHFHLDKLKTFKPQKIFLYSCGLLLHSEIKVLQSHGFEFFIFNQNSPSNRFTEETVKLAIRYALPAYSDNIININGLQNEIYTRIVNKKKVHGIQWHRFKGLNDIFLGHRQGEITLVSGLTGAGKTTFISEYSLDLCEQGVSTLWGSFEISLIRLCEIMLQQFAGAPLPVSKQEFSYLVSQFAELSMHFMTFQGKEKISSVLEVMTEAVELWDVRHIIIDNLQFMLGVQARPQDNWIEQDRAVSALRTFATTKNCHITVISHPKKGPPDAPLTIDSISGGARVTQEADNIILLQTLFNNNIKTQKKALHIIKNRFGGNLAVLPLRFHKPSLTMSSYFLEKGQKLADNETTASEDVAILESWK